ncbi:undecaprenyl-phosphate glucose phosphotransferase [Paenibacillus crassostreae]|uniref:Undecaprenyl-phosphate glucose phosphotransferase n=1 Tax=Paenibacillus crassostreae TaxID=1763538 RepID=A0A167E217_9BACL|nr:undecaprenyl-phosphate glucose phosphotransferase [Paenibacillus crassostreae]AOZ93315.1 undecaprenyl-phosphate glucose phosphotransferase [Paenibacillus crassostreae]OAB75039.1 undecaprenyl-phosphate glucose phosphotransferase [Paenibacillus crassostreae]
MIRRNQGILTKLYILSDFFVVQMSFLLAWWLKFESGWIPYETPKPIESYMLWSLIYGGITILTGIVITLYSPKRKKRFADEFLKVIQVHFISMFLLISIMFVVKEIDISRVYLAIYLGLNIFFIIFYRYFLKASLKHFREKGYNRQFVLIVGAGSLGKRFFNNLKQYPELGYEVVGFLDDNQVWDNVETAHYSPILGNLDDLEDILTRELIDEVVLALPLDAHSKYKKIIVHCEKAGVRTLIIPDFFDYLPARPYFDNFAGMPMINVRDIPLDVASNRMFKRLFDIVFSLCTIIIISPVLLAVALGVKFTSPGPIIFKQERVGLNRRHFMMYKFRSMKQQIEEGEDTGWTVENDPRRTKFGTFIRSTSLDELPQFFNVLMGHMSVVGPRPERPYFVDQFRDEIPKYMVKHHVRPGITGWAQSNGLRGDTSIEDRINHDIFYIENWTLLLDVRIIMKTIKNGFKNNNAY